MRIALVFPRLWSQVHGMWSSLGLASLGTVLKDAGEEVRIFDSSFDVNLERVKRALKSFQPDLLGIYTLSDFYHSANDLVKFGKVLGARTVLGAAHPTILPEQTLKDIPELDFLIRGEGEKAILELLKALRGEMDYSAVRGLGYRRDGGIVLNSVSEAGLNLDSLPIPERELLENFHKYLRSGAINLHISRGCPFNCSFCQPTLRLMFGRRLRWRSAGLVREEIGILNKRYGVREFFFHDDIFTVNKRWLGELVEGLNQGGLVKGFRYVVNSRVDTFDEEVARLLKEMGVYYVLFGLESGSQEVLDRLEKGTRVEQAYQAFELCKKFGFRTHAYIILAGLGESKDSLLETEKMIKELKPNTVHISICTPLPGTNLEREAREQGLINIDDYVDMDYYLKRTSKRELPLALSGLSYDEVLEVRERILRGRRWMVFWDNLVQMFRGLVWERSLGEVVFRLRFYGKMRHYFG